MNIAQLLPLRIPQEALVALRQRGITELNSIQADALDAGLLEGRSLLVVAPTSAGKTLLAELAALRQAGSGLTVILVSHKALARQTWAVLRTSYSGDPTPLLRTAILTGDQDTLNGEWGSVDVVVSTYERFYGAVTTNSQVLGRLRTLVIDEFQIVGDEARGPNLELLTARARYRQQSHDLQLLALSATISNTNVLTDWLDADLVFTDRREPPLDHEVWLPGQRRVFEAGEEEPTIVTHDLDTESLGAIVGTLTEDGRSPIVVMATTKPAAQGFLEELVETHPVDTSFPMGLVDEFRAMGEGTSLTETVCAALPRRLGLHLADMTPEQLRVIEDAFREGNLDTVVATPTLVAGVNLPIRSVVYPSLLRWDGEAESYIHMTEFLNGAGRAGRQGFHSRGTCVVRAGSLAEASNIDSIYFRSEVEPATSQLEGRSKEFVVLHLLVSRGPCSIGQLAEAASFTLFGTERGLMGNPDRIAELCSDMERTIREEQFSALWNLDSDGQLSLSTVGRAIAASGLEPTLVLYVMDEIAQYVGRERDGDGEPLNRRLLLLGLCHSPGVDEFLPFYSNFRNQWALYLQPEIQSALQIAWVPETRNAVGFVHALISIGDSIPPDHIQERMLDFRAERTRTSEHLGRILAAGATAFEAADPRAGHAVAFRLQSLADRLEFQASEQTLPVARLFRERRVRGVGPVRIGRLAAACDGEIGRILKLTNAQLEAAVGRSHAQNVKRAALAYLGGLTKEQSRRQLRSVGSDIELQGLVADLLGRSGRSFEPAVGEALERLGWDVSPIGEQSGPKADLKGETASGIPVLVECKTTQDLAGEVCRDEALDILRKLPEGFEGLALTVARPVFSYSAVADRLKRDSELGHIRFVTAGALVEMLLALRSGVNLDILESTIQDFSHVDVARVLAEVGSGSSMCE